MKSLVKGKGKRLIWCYWRCAWMSSSKLSIRCVAIKSDHLFFYFFHFRKENQSYRSWPLTQKNIFSDGVYTVLGVAPKNVKDSRTICSVIPFLWLLCKTVWKKAATTINLTWVLCWINKTPTLIVIPVKNLTSSLYRRKKKQTNSRRSYLIWSICWLKRTWRWKKRKRSASNSNRDCARTLASHSLSPKIHLIIVS